MYVKKLGVELTERQVRLRVEEYKEQICRRHKNESHGWIAALQAPGGDVAGDLRAKVDEIGAVDLHVWRLGSEEVRNWGYWREDLDFRV